MFVTNNFENWSELDSPFNPFDLFVDFVSEATAVNRFERCLELDFRTNIDSKWTILLSFRRQDSSDDKRREGVTNGKEVKTKGFGQHVSLSHTSLMSGTTFPSFLSSFPKGSQSVSQLSPFRYTWSLRGNQSDNRRTVLKSIAVALFVKSDSSL